MSKLTFGVIGTSKKVDERRLPIHPDHLKRLPEDIDYSAVDGLSNEARQKLEGTESTLQTRRIS